MFPISSYRSSGTTCFLFCRRLSRSFFCPEVETDDSGSLVEKEDESCALIGGWKPFLSSIYAKSTLSSKSRVWPLHSASRTKCQLRFWIKQVIEWSPPYHAYISTSPRSRFATMVFYGEPRMCFIVIRKASQNLCFGRKFCSTLHRYNVWGRSVQVVSELSILVNWIGGVGFWTKRCLYKNKFHGKLLKAR
jgi:hypothetical protein